MSDQLMSVANTKNFQFFINLKSFKQVSTHLLNLWNIRKHRISATWYNNSINI
jgi:hypothetical protein